MLISVSCLVVALVCEAVPTALLSNGPVFWMIAGLLAWAADVLLEGRVVVRRP
jgi:hypothetical protein